MQNPFTTTFSKAPEMTYISTEKTNEILENFSYKRPSESVYKITGVRGSGKTVILAKIEESLKSESAKSEGWLVFDLSPARDILEQLAAMLHENGFGPKDTKNKNINLSFSILGTGGGIGFSSEDENQFFDIGVEIEKMIVQATSQNKRILIGIDEVSKTKTMIEFASEYGRWLRAGYPVYLVCTGLYENIQEVSNVKNLTFFRRATTVKTDPLNTIRMTEMYKKTLDISHEEAYTYAQMTKGYAYAFQKLGALCFLKRQKMESIDVIQDLKTELYAYAYEKIWEEMTNEDRYLISLLLDKREYKREEVLNLMGEKQKNYSVYRDRLLKRGILKARQGYVELALPYFGEFVKEYCI